MSDPFDTYEEFVDYLESRPVRLVPPCSCPPPRRPADAAACESLASVGGAYEFVAAVAAEHATQHTASLEVRERADEGAL